MTRRIKRIAPLPAGKMLGVLYACMGLIFLPFVAVAGLIGVFAEQTQQSQGAGSAATIGIVVMMVVFGLLIPVFYGVMGFVAGVVGAAIYNVIAQWIGGIEVEVE